VNEYKHKGAEILGVSFDTVEANRAFAEKFQFPYKLLCDTERRIGLAYGACDDAKAPAARRISYLIDPEGTVRQSWGTTSKLDVKTHPTEVLSHIPG
jgi:peroxiredoxin Q/BCP